MQSKAAWDHYHLIFSGDVAPDIASGPGDRRQPHVFGDALPCAAPDPNLEVGVGGVDLVVGHLEGDHRAGLSLELVALGELGQLPDADHIGLGARVNEAIGGGHGEDLAVLLEDGGNAAGSGGGVEEGGGGEAGVEGWEEEWWRGEKELKSEPELGWSLAEMLRRNRVLVWGPLIAKDGPGEPAGKRLMSFLFHRIPVRRKDSPNPKSNSHQRSHHLQPPAQPWTATCAATSLLRSPCATKQPPTQPPAQPLRNQRATNPASARAVQPQSRAAQSPAQPCATSYSPVQPLSVKSNLDWYCAAPTNPVMADSLKEVIPAHMVPVPSPVPVSLSHSQPAQRVTSVLLNENNFHAWSRSFQLYPSGKRKTRWILGKEPKPAEAPTALHDDPIPPRPLPILEPPSSPFASQDLSPCAQAPLPASSPESGMSPPLVSDILPPRQGDERKDAGESALCAQAGASVSRPPTILSLACDSSDTKSPIPTSDLSACPGADRNSEKTVEWTTKDLLKGLEEFVPIYETRPIKNNMYGMGFDHSFGLWFIAQWLKPDLMIESGAFKGHSTWVLRQAMPDKPIVSLTPRHPEKYLKKGPAYVDGNCTYFAGKDFVDFGSLNWGNVMKKHGISDLSRVLIFFDDHQNELKRLKQALKAGFRHLVFEDNYDTGTGDHYSLRQICDQFYIRGGGHSCFKDSDEARIRTRRRKFWEKAVDIGELCGPGEAWWGVKGHMRDDFNHSNKAITYSEHFQNSRFVESVLEVYWELPPVAGPSLTHQTRYDPARAPIPIVEDGRFGLFQRLGLTRLENSVFNGYTQMVYLQISAQKS
ncbi:hypothetical protein Acr_11g0013700 [Actinidia rufa]|uniref:Retrotransposon Copia-like N-terminal domain-containing protein n=1 Tax=Actinidia rufa TaxID=165716 RepID=A0A7J0FED4_9ERIC|nr:hypothetical protein Acr_11g0013700 [Actinidia rufa]